MAADLDVLIRSPDDPLVAWTYHRHFTHSLAFIPIGGMISAIPWVFRKRFAAQRRAIVAATTLGYATHALLDAFTSYGTQLLWPFSSARIAWNWIAVVDPLFTVPLGIGVWMCARRERLRPLIWASLFAAIYMLVGGLQHARAREQATLLANERGHTPSRLEAFPGLLSNVLWRSVYVDRGVLYVDAIRTPWIGAASSRAAGSLPLADVTTLDPELLASPDAVRAFETFAWFADGWVAATPGEPRAFGDVRYGADAMSPRAMWGIEVASVAPIEVRGWQERPPASALGRRWALWWTGFWDGEERHAETESERPSTGQVDSRNLSSAAE